MCQLGPLLGTWGSRDTLGAPPKASCCDALCLSPDHARWGGLLCVLLPAAPACARLQHRDLEQLQCLRVHKQLRHPSGAGDVVHRAGVAIRAGECCGVMLNWGGCAEGSQGTTQACGSCGQCGARVLLGWLGVGWQNPSLPSWQAKSKGRSKAQPKHAMRFPGELMHSMRAREEHKLICIYIHSPCIFLDEQNSSVLNNHILGAFLQNRAVTGLKRPVEIQFWHNLDASNATCVFWVPGAGKSGSWSREGCETEHREGTVVCHCSHLTYFAVLMLSGGPVLESLTYISTVGCSISAAATFCTLLRRPKDTTTRIHMNLLAALFLLNGSFLLSKPLATSTELCQAAAALLHGSLLCSLAWMGAEAFHLYLLLVKVYNIYIQHYLLKLCLCAWGLPTLVVMAVVIFSGETYGRHVISTTDGYQNMNMCWLTSSLAHFVTFCYAGLILLFNTLMLAAVVVMLRRIKSQKGQARRDWATVLGLTCLLGTTWGLAFFSFGVLLIPQLYLFTILNSLQGQWGAPGQGRRSGGGKPVGACELATLHPSTVAMGKPAAMTVPPPPCRSLHLPVVHHHIPPQQVQH
uniref:Adhesion G protein-coupled receptor G5 n=1 Tax=Anas zonorhyncha TaxID=75864 RepID=A0A8B9V5M0_9AVES